MQGVDNLLRLVCLPILPVIPAACASLPEAAPEPPPAEPPPSITVTQHADGIVFAGVEAGGNVNITVYSPPAGTPSPGEPDTPQARVEAGGPAEPVPDLPMDVLDTLAAEGYEEAPYESGGDTHVCYGHNLDAGIHPNEWAGLGTPQACIDLFYADLAIATDVALAFAGDDAWRAMGAPRNAALIDLAFILGGPRLAAFTDLRAALRTGDWTGAVGAVLDSCLPPGNRKPACKGTAPIARERLDGIVEAFRP